MDDLRFVSKIEDEFKFLYKDHSEAFNKNVPEYIKEIRDDAMNSFLKLGIPSKKVEDYRSTDIRKIYEHNYEKFIFPEKYDVDLREVFQCNVPELDTHLLLLINGQYYTENDSLLIKDKGVIVCGLAEAFSKYPELVKKHFSKHADHTESGLTALNTVLSQDGLFIYIPEHVKLSKAIQVVNLLRADQDRMIHQRNLVIADKGSELKLIICDHTLSEHKYFSNNVTEVYAGENSVLDIYNMQDEHNDAAKINSVYINQNKHSNVLNATITLHGGIVRNNIYARLNDEHCENHTYGIYFADKKQHIDNYSFIDHAKPNCTSNELFKGILDDEATGAFSGRIYVAKDAQNTNAFQSNNNILLTDDARMTTKPQLEIYADDVKCSHGATVGQLDEEALFYIRSRGIDTKEAKMLLMFAFANEVINKVRVIPLRDRIEDLVNKRLKGELTRCANCAVNCYKA
jgi:Fe-S cluster assembly protein SufD